MQYNERRRRKQHRHSKQLYDAYKRHDIYSVLDMFTDHAVLHGPAPAGALPWGGIYDGRGRIADFFKAVS
jgi:hypothetical protein